MRTPRLLALAGATVAALMVSGCCILPPPHDHGHDRRGDGRYGDRGDGRGDWNDGSRGRGERPAGPPPGGGYGPRYDR